MALGIVASGVAFAFAAQAAAPAQLPKIAPPNPRAFFTGGSAPLIVDGACRGLTIATLAASRPCSDRVERGESAPIIEVAMTTIMSAADDATAKAGLALLEKAIAAEDHPAIHYLLGSLLTTGERFPPDYLRGIAHLEKAVAGGNVAAMDLLAINVLEGRGTAQDPARAIALFERAAAGGMAGSAVRLASYHLKGEWIPKDESRGRAILDAAQAAGDPQARMAMLMATAKITNYQLHPRADGEPELRGYGAFDSPPIPPGFGFTDDFAKVHRAAFSDAAVAARLEREHASLPTPYTYELARRTVATDPAKALGWYMLARLRMSYDAGRCASPQALEALQGWDMLVHRDLAAVLRYAPAAQHQAAVDFALKEEARLPAATRPWWVCYASMEAFGTAMEKKPVALALRPAAEWPSIRDKAREAIKALRNGPPAR